MAAPAIPLIDEAAGNSRVLVKVCGFREESSFRAALDAGVDAVGLNFWPGSKRFVLPAEAALWVAANPHPALRIGVFVNPSDDEVLAPWQAGVIAAAQLHGDESPDQCARLMARGIPLIKAFGWTGAGSLRRARDCGTPYLLADAHAPGEFGGTGRTFDWAGLRGACAAFPDTRLILSGGLVPDNVADAVVAVHPVMVDAASGVESAPGIKDPAKLAGFVNAARAVGIARGMRD